MNLYFEECEDLPDMGNLMTEAGKVFAIGMKREDAEAVMQALTQDVPDGHVRWKGHRYQIVGVGPPEVLGKTIVNADPATKWLIALDLSPKGPAHDE